MYKVALLLCAQALVFQSVFSQCLQTAPAYNIGTSCGCGNGLIGNAGLISNGLLGNAGLIGNTGIVGNAGVQTLSGYGGQGTGELTAAGELPVCGTTALEGRLPVYGLVQFSGNVPAGGLVTLLGNTPDLCSCPCNGGLLY